MDKHMYLYNFKICKSPLFNEGDPDTLNEKTKKSQLQNQDKIEV